jgi:alcohol dehydrogenase class IV
MSHSIGGLFDQPHGECNSLLIDHVVRFNWPRAGHRYAALADSLEVPVEGLSTDAVRGAFIKALVGFKHRIGIKASLADLGIRKQDIPQLARMAVDDPCMATNPISPTINDIETVYAQAL